jgi:hypothetical protein
MTTAITPEIVGLETTILEDSPMTDSEEKELVIVKTAIQTAYADKLERDLAIGAGLLKIFRRKLYRGKNGGRTWEQWLAEESAELTAGQGAINFDKSRRLRAFYQFRCEVLSSLAAPPAGLALPASPEQVRPLIGQLDTHPEAAIGMWKAAVADAKGKVPTVDQVNRAAQAWKANEANEARRLSSAQQAAQQKAVAASVASRPAAVQAPQPVQQAPTPDFSPRPQPQPTPAPSIPAWEMEKDDASIDAGAECKRITQAINDAHKAIGLLRGILYSQLNKYGSEYLTVLRQVDAGVYSLNNIDNQVQQMGEDIAFISELLVKDVGEGELAQSTVDVASFPTRA